MILLDTDVLIEILDKKSAKGATALQAIGASGESFAITVITLHEILYGLSKYAKPLDEVLQLPVLDYTRQDAQLSAQVEWGAEQEGRMIPRTDAMIAAIAINHGARLFTADLGDFSPAKAFGLRLFV
jgi:tRNA(fMet)-specific endonuclease VapC